MKSFKRRSLSTGFLLLVFSANLFSANKYIEVVAYRANVRVAATTSATLVVTSHRGDIFELLGENPNWYQIQLFSGEIRHLHKSLAKEVLYKPEVPEDTALRSQIFQALNEAEARVIKEADQRYPPNSRLPMNLQYQTQLRDKYKLEVMHQLNSQAPIFRRIFLEGLKNDW
ncbi:MAG: SH3 domain-containing protein [Acidobacteriota bacterium]